MRHAACMLLGATLAGVAFAAVLDVAGALSAQGAGSGRVPLRGQQALVPPGATLLGPAPSTTTLPLDITLQPRDPAALATEVRAVSDPASPEYRHFLTPAEFAQRFGPTPGTIAKVASVLRSEGLVVGPPSATGLSLPVSGTVAQVQSAFSTPIARYRLASGRTGYDNRAAPEVPVSVAPQIQGVLGLDTLSPPHPTTTLPQASSLTPHAGTPAVSPALAPNQPTPQPSCAPTISTVQGTYGALDADQLAQAYSFDPLYSANHYGAGTTVALVELYGAGYVQSDIDTFAACYGIGDGQVTQVDMNGGGGLTGGATAESELDIETALSLAPKANIEVYEGGQSDDLYTIFSRIVSDDTAKIVSVSWTNGCEAYVAPAFQSSENTILAAAASEGQSFFVASGDQGSQGCNLNGEVSAPTGTGPMAQAVDPSTGTLYVANRSDGTLNVDSEGGTNVGNATQASKPFTGVTPDAVALAPSAGKVFVANAGSNSLTAFSTATCNKTTTSGCGSPTQITSGGHLSTPKSLAANGTTLYVGNGNGTVAVYNATTNLWKATVTLPSSSVPSALAVDATNGFVYVADSSNGRVEYFNAATCNAGTTSGCGTTPATVSVGNSPVGLAVAGGAGDLYVANAGSGGGISVVSLSTHAVVTTIPTSQPSNGTGLVQSVGLSPDGHEVLAALSGLGFPGDVMATVNTSTQTISSTVNLEIATDAMGQLVSDPTLGYTWVTDETKGGDVVQNLNLAVSDPASQPYVTAVGGTSFGHLTPTIGPPPSESVWNDQQYYSEGAGGGGISKSFTMPAYQQPLGTVSGSSGTPCANAGGDCREVPDVSADADPSTGYIVYDSVAGFGGWGALGGTSGAAPLWAAVLAVAASADGNTAGYGALNPALYLLAQESPGTYFNDVTSGNNDYNATNGGSFPALSGYDMATGLGTPVTSQLATGLTGIPLAVAVSGTQTYGGSPTFTATADYAGPGTTPFGVTLNATGLTCTTVGTSTTISPTLGAGPYTLSTSSCGGLVLSGPNASDYAVVLTSAPNDFTVAPAHLTITAANGSMTYGGTVPIITPSFSGFVNGDTSSSLTTPPTCTTTATSSSPASPPTYASTCSGAADPNYSISYGAGAVTVNKAPLTITASNVAMTYGGTVPSVVAGYSGFVNGDGTTNLTTKPTCSTTATSSSPVAGSPYVSSCAGAADPNYAISYVPGSVTVNPAPLTITAGSPSMTYGGSVPAVTPLYTGFVSGDTSSSLTTPPTCSTTATASSPASPPTYPSTCGGAADPNYAITYAAGAVTVSPAPLTISASSGVMVYGGSVPGIIPNYSGFVNGDSSSSLTTLPGCSTSATGSSPASPPTYPSSCNGAADPNYAISYVAGAVTVTKAPLTVTASNGSMTYGGTAPIITPSFSGFVNGDTSSSLATQPTCTTTATGSSPASPPTYPTSCSGAADADYSISYVAGAVTVGKAPLTITASSPSMSYGSSPPAVTAQYSGFVDGDTSSSLTTPPTCTTTATSSSPASPPTYPSSCSGAADPNYTIGYVAGAVTVNKAPLTITASNGTMTFGGTVPAVTPGYAGFVNGDTSSSLTTQPACSTTATGSSPASPPTYPSTCSGASDPNYTIGYVAGAVTVNKAPLTITASSGSMTYGGSVPAITPGYAGFVNGNNPSSLTTPPACSTTATAASPASPPTYPSSCGGAADPNYSMTYVAGAVTVNRASLTVTASSSAVAYGSVPVVAPLYTGFVNGDTPSSLTTPPTCSTTATSSSPASPPTYPSSCSGAADPDYTIAYVPGTVTVNKAPLTITASSGSMTYGGSVPAVTPGYAGFVNGNTPSSLTTPPTCSTTATGSSGVAGSPYTSSCTGAAAANYTIAYVPGTVAVSKAALTISASSGSMTYGGTVPAVTPGYAGFVNGDTPSSLTTPPTCTTTANGASPASPPSYPTSCSGAADVNYAVTYVGGSITVGKAPLTVTASSPAATYGSPPPAVTPLYSGFVNGDTSSSLTTKPTCTTTATSSSPASPPAYPSSCSGAADPDYTIGYVPGSVAVNPAPLTVTASSGSMTYGGTVPTITAGFSGFKNGDTSSSLTTPPTCSTAATSSSPVSPPTYAASCSGAADPDYTITNVGGTVTVTPAPITVGVSGSQSDGGAPTFIGTDTPPPGVNVGGTLTCGQVDPSTTISNQLPSGTYTLVATSCGGLTSGGADAADYAVTYTGSPGDFTVTGGPSASTTTTSSPPPPPDPAHGYWLVGSDGGIFTFGSASFYGSTGSLTLQRPVVGITPTRDRAGYWLVASDGGTFAFGDAGFYGSIPGLGLHPAGSGLPHSLNAPIVAMVPASDGQGYFVVASDGGVFAFGPGASFAGSCPGIGGCSGPAVSVIPDATGHGYWLFTATGNVYTFGDAPFLGSPGPVGSAVTSAVRTPDGKGYWVLVANGTVYAYGDAANDGSPGGQFGGYNPATAVFATSDGSGYWVVGAVGAVEPYGDAPNDGGMTGTKLNGPIIAATGF